MLDFQLSPSAVLTRGSVLSTAGRSVPPLFLPTPGKPAAVRALSCDDGKHQALSDVLGGRGSRPVETIKLTRPLTECGPALGSPKKGRCSGPPAQPRPLDSETRGWSPTESLLTSHPGDSHATGRGASPLVGSLLTAASWVPGLARWSIFSKCQNLGYLITYQEGQGTDKSQSCNVGIAGALPGGHAVISLAVMAERESLPGCCRQGATWL